MYHNLGQKTWRSMNRGTFDHEFPDHFWTRGTMSDLTKVLGSTDQNQLVQNQAVRPALGPGRSKIFSILGPGQETFWNSGPNRTTTTNNLKFLDQVGPVGPRSLWSVDPCFGVYFWKEGRMSLKQLEWWIVCLQEALNNIWIMISFNNYSLEIVCLRIFV